MRAFRQFRFLPCLLLIAALVSLPACSLFHRGKKGDVLDTLPVAQLYDKGVGILADGNYEFASRIFARLVARFPFGPYTEQAQINLAYAQYKDGKAEEAYSTINRFIKTYPTNRHVDYAYYLRGLINFNRTEGFIEQYIGEDMTKRDQAFQHQGFDDFNALVTRYPTSIYTADARQRMVFLRNAVAQSELNVAFFYFKRKAFVAASDRAKYIVDNYPQSPQIADALAIMTDSYKRLGQDKLADDSERVLKLNYPNHPFFEGDWPHYRSNWWKFIPLSNRGT